jgi:hypothetical protein
MESTEIADILTSLADDFETLMDLENMDWVIFEYDRTPPWFYIHPAEIDVDGMPPTQTGYTDGQIARGIPRRTEEWRLAEVDRRVRLRGRFVETIEALRKAAKEIT